MYVKRNNRNRHLDGMASTFLLLFHALVLVFGATDSGQPILQLVDCGVICALGTVQLTLGQGTFNF